MGGEIEFDEWLEDQLLRDPLVIFRLVAGGYIALVREEQLAIHLEPIGGEALDAEDEMGALRVGAEIMADAGLEVEPWVEGAAVEELHLGRLRGFAESSLPFGFEPDFVIVAAVPALAVPLVAVAPLPTPGPGKAQ